MFTIKWLQRYSNMSAVKNNSYPSSSTLSVTGVAAAVAVVTTVFSIGYMTASYYTKKKLLQQIYHSTSGCIILQDDNPVSSVTDPMTIIPAPRRFGACIKLKPDKYIEYRTLHDNVWDHVQQRIYDSHIRNFTIYYHPETSTLYQHFEWIGHWYVLQNDNKSVSQQFLSVEEEQALLDADFYAIAQDPVTREWWKLCEPCQEPFSQWYQQEQPAQDTDDRNKNETVLLFPSEGNTTGDWWAPMECVCHTGHYPIAFSSQTRDPDFMTLKP
jgi:L-rhamnose mutarotase